MSLSPIWAVLTSLLLGAGLIIAAGANPITAYYAIFMGAFSDIWGINSTLLKTIPLMFAGVAVALAFKGGYFNIGIGGQIFLGGIGAALAGLYLKGLPPVLHIFLAFLAGFITGGVWSLVPGYLKAARGVNEIITCIFMHFIAYYFLEYMASGPLMELGAPAPMSPEIAKSAQLPIIIPNTDVHLGLIFAMALAVILQVVFKKTTIGYQITATGLNPTACRYAGMNTVRNIIILSFVSGGLAGMAGASEIMGLKHRLFGSMPFLYGLEAIAIVFLAKTNPIGVMIGSLFLGALRSGAEMMQRSIGVPTDLARAIEGFVILFVAISIALPQWRPDWFKERIDSEKIN